MNDKCATRTVNYRNKFPWRVYIYEKYWINFERRGKYLVTFSMDACLLQSMQSEAIAYE